MNFVYISSMEFEELTEKEVAEKLYLYIEASRTSSYYGELIEYLDCIAELVYELGSDSINEILYTYQKQFHNYGIEIESSKFDFSVLEQRNTDETIDLEVEQEHHDMYGEPVTEFSYTISIFDHSPKIVYIRGIISLDYPGVYWEIINEHIDNSSHFNVDQLTYTKLDHSALENMVFGLLSNN